MMFETEQEKFIYSQVVMMTLAATLGRNKTYSTNNDGERAEVRKGIEFELKKISKKYVNNVSEKEHQENIVTLANIISEKYSSYLENRFRIGSAQKALNLYLKYLWCLGKIVEPPHFPIDAIMLAKIPNCSGISWTKFDTIYDYEKIIKEAKKVAGNKTLANWELDEYTSQLKK